MQILPNMNLTPFCTHNFYGYLETDHSLPCTLATFVILCFLLSFYTNSFVLFTNIHQSGTGGEAIAY